MFCFWIFFFTSRLLFHFYFIFCSTWTFIFLFFIQYILLFLNFSLETFSLFWVIYVFKNYFIFEISSFLDTWNFVFWYNCSFLKILYSDFCFSLIFSLLKIFWNFWHLIFRIFEHFLTCGNVSFTPIYFIFSFLENFSCLEISKFLDIDHYWIFSSYSVTYFFLFFNFVILHKILFFWTVLHFNVFKTSHVCEVVHCEGEISRGDPSRYFSFVFTMKIKRMPSRWSPNLPLKRYIRLTNRKQFTNKWTNISKTWFYISSWILDAAHHPIHTLTAIKTLKNNSQCSRQIRETPFPSYLFYERIYRVTFWSFKIC